MFSEMMEKSISLLTELVVGINMVMVHHPYHQVQHIKELHLVIMDIIMFWAKKVKSILRAMGLEDGMNMDMEIHLYQHHQIMQILQLIVTMSLH